MQNQIEVICKCPLCCLAYRQVVTAKWIGRKWRPRRYEVALRALCEEAGQGRGDDCWAGLAYCTECSIRNAPPALRETVRKWLQEGERSL